MTPRPLRVLFHLYMPVSPRAAGMQQTARVAGFLAHAGAQVTLHVCTCRFSTRREFLDFFRIDDTTRLDIVFHAFPPGPDATRRQIKAFGSRWLRQRLLTLLLTREKARYDVFFARGHRFPGIYALLRRWLGFKVVFEFHEIVYLDRVAEEDLLRTQPRIDLERAAYRHADGVICITQALKGLAERKWGPRPGVTVIPSGAILFDSEPRPPRPIRRVFFVGNPYRFSGIDCLVKAMKRLPEEVTLTIVGGGGPGDGDYDRVRELAGSEGVASRVEMRGFVEPAGLPAVYAEADVLCMPLLDVTRTRYFISPLKVFDYMSARRAILASDVPTAREVLADGENALLVEPGNPDALAAGVRRLMDDPALADRLAERAYADSQQYSLLRKCERVRAFLEEIVRPAPNRVTAGTAKVHRP